MLDEEPTGPSGVFGFVHLRIQDIYCNYKFIVPSILRPPGRSLSLEPDWLPPGLVGIIGEAAVQTGRLSVIAGPADACHHSRQLLLPE